MRRIAEIERTLSLVSIADAHKTHEENQKILIQMTVAVVWTLKGRIFYVVGDENDDRSATIGAALKIRTKPKSGPNFSPPSNQYGPSMGRS